MQAFAGSGKPGSEDGVGINASFNHPAGIAIDQNTGNMFVCDNNNNSIRKITVQGMLKAQYLCITVRNTRNRRSDNPSWI